MIILSVYIKVKSETFYLFSRTLLAKELKKLF